MRRRVFVPEVPGSLEGRLLLSGGVGPHRGATAISGLRYNTTIDMIRIDFEQFATSGDFPRFRTQLHQSAAKVPFGQADSLGGSINAILDRMQTGLALAASHAIAAAYHEVVVAIHSTVQARIDSGMLVVR